MFIKLQPQADPLNKKPIKPDTQINILIELAMPL